MGDPLNIGSHEKKRPALPSTRGRQNVCPSHHRGPIDRERKSNFPDLLADFGDREMLLQWMKAQQPQPPTGNWKFILDTLRSYSQRNAHNPHSSILSHQMYLIAVFSYKGRKQNGQGWAGGFVEFVFLYAAKSVDKDPKFWDNPPGTEEHDVFPHGSRGDYRFSALTAGNHHFDLHLAPSFKQYIDENFRRIISNSSNADRLKNLVAFIDELTTEHEAFIKYAVIPAFDRVRVLGSAFGDIERWGAKRHVEPNARNLRKNTIDRVSLELKRQNLITGNERLRILSATGFNVLPPF